jgi:NTP pyrophosphatase (non-canonical NTP hydrolase)
MSDAHPGTGDLARLTDLIRDFSVERDWVQFHDPKSLVLALVGEVGELAELVQWLPADAAAEHFADPDRHRRAGEEIADVLVYLLRLADVLGVDVLQATLDKQAEARRRFPVDSVRGIAPHRD